MVLLDDTATESAEGSPEALIPEARERQRRRRRRAGMLLVGALLVAGVSFVLFGGGGSTGLSLDGPLPVGVAARAPDPTDGLSWGVRLVRASGWTCLQLGRLRGDQLGLVGTDDWFHNDGRFHPFRPSTTYQAACAHNDGNGHAFMTIELGSLPASASMVSWTGTAGCDLAIEVAGFKGAVKRSRSSRSGGASSVPPTCPADDQRFIQYGLLGPDATSITYTVGGRPQMERTRGPDGAYLVVGPATPSFCARFGRGSGCGGPGTRPSSIGDGMILAVHYRDGQTCQPNSGRTRLPAFVRQCPRLGYVPPKPTILPSQVQAPVSLRVINAKRFCLTSGSSLTRFGPAPPVDLGLYLPCNKPMPATDSHPGQVTRGMLFTVSWTARHAVTSPDNAYTYLVYSPRCGGGGGATDERVAAGERLTRGLFMTSTCTGTFTATVTYLPNIGPDRQPFRGGPGNAESVLVGRSNIKIRSPLH